MSGLPESGDGWAIYGLDAAIAHGFAAEEAKRLRVSLYSRMLDCRRERTAAGA
jgi:hypothetical protein